MWSNHTRDYYSAIRKNEALTHATMWVSLEDMLGERSQTQETSCSGIPFI